MTGLSERDTVLFLLSGGGSALFEKPLISGEELRDVTSSLLASGADIVEMNTIRKRLSAVKGGRFALGYEPLLLTDRLCCEAREAGSFLASILQSHASSERSLAFIAGGETVVHLTGSGLGGVLLLQVRIALRF